LWKLLFAEVVIECEEDHVLFTEDVMQQKEDKKEVLLEGIQQQLQQLIVTKADVFRTEVDIPNNGLITFSGDDIMGRSNVHNKPLY
ncbi:hypothetical protein KK473_27940, partial [Klebsiella pneumoniae]|uniref:hypothetical protein n=1 Tax=Klebsiella pneumoniae TaxID=573 RepID=UPI001BE065DD